MEDSESKWPLRQFRQMSSNWRWMWVKTFPEKEEAEAKKWERRLLQLKWRITQDGDYVFHRGEHLSWVNWNRPHAKYMKSPKSPLFFMPTANLRVPKMTLRFNNLLVGLSELSHYTHGYSLLQQRYRSKWNREDVHKVGFEGFQAQAPSYPFPVESWGQALTFPATMCGNPMEYCPPWKLTWALVPEFLLGLGQVDMFDTYMADFNLYPAPLEVKLTPCGSRLPNHKSHY